MDSVVIFAIISLAGDGNRSDSWSIVNNRFSKTLCSPLQWDSVIDFCFLNGALLKSESSIGL